MFGIGSTELLVILVVALIVLGPKSMANVSRTLGKALGEFRRVSTDFQRTLNAEAEEEEQKKRKKEAAQAAREAVRAEAEAAQNAGQATGQPAGQAEGQVAGQAAGQIAGKVAGQTSQADAQATDPQDTPAAEAVLDTTAVHPEQPAEQDLASAEALADAQYAPEAATDAEQPQTPAACETANADAGVPMPPEGSPLAEALARTEAEARAAEARLAQTATASENGGKA